MFCPSCGKSMKSAGEDTMGGLRHSCLACKVNATYHSEPGIIELDKPLRGSRAATFTAAVKDDLLKVAEGAYNEDAYAEADFEQVVNHLRTDAGLTDAEVHASGGGIDVIRIPVGTKYVLYFGTAAEMWGASVYETRPDGDEEHTGDIWTDVSSDNTDPSAVALGIAEAAMKFDEGNDSQPKQSALEPIGYGIEPTNDSSLVPSNERCPQCHDRLQVDSKNPGHYVCLVCDTEYEEV